MWSGYSSCLFAFGRNSNIPSTLTDHPPALEETTNSNSFYRYMNALYTTRQAFNEAESSDKIRRALCSKLLNHSAFFKGDRVFYKHDNLNRWKEPGAATG